MRSRRYEFFTRENIETAINNSKASKVCLGCEKPYKTDPYTRDCAETQIGIWDVLTHDKLSCADKARERLAACPGCGDGSIAPGMICEDCGALLDKAREALPRLAQLRAVEIKKHDLGPALGSYYEQPDMTALANLIAQAVSSLQAPKLSRNELGSRDTFAYIMPEQHDAVKSLMAKIAEVMTLQRNAGREEGHKLLVALAQGEITTQKFEELEAKASNGAKLGGE